jgi:hypothetical protein
VKIIMAIIVIAVAVVGGVRAWASTTTPMMMPHTAHTITVTDTLLLTNTQFDKANLLR